MSVRAIDLWVNVSMGERVPPFERCIGEAQHLDLRSGVLEKYLFGNAESFFFGPRKPRY